MQALRVKTIAENVIDKQHAGESSPADSTKVFEIILF
jgi:hypothetical protein